MGSELTRMVDAAMAALASYPGWSVVRQGDGWKVVPPDGKRGFLVHRTPRDGRSVLNEVGRIKRYADQHGHPFPAKRGTFSWEPYRRPRG